MNFQVIANSWTTYGLVSSTSILFAAISASLSPRKKATTDASERATRLARFNKNFSSSATKHGTREKIV